METIYGHVVRCTKHEKCNSLCQTENISSVSLLFSVLFIFSAFSFLSAFHSNLFLNKFFQHQNDHGFTYSKT